MVNTKEKGNIIQNVLVGVGTWADKELTCSVQKPEARGQRHIKTNILSYNVEHYRRMTWVHWQVKLMPFPEGLREVKKETKSLGCINIDTEQKSEQI